MSLEYGLQEKALKEPSLAEGVASKVRGLFRKLTSPMIVSGSLLMLPTTTSANSEHLLKGSYLTDLNTDLTVEPFETFEKPIQAADYKNHCHMVSTFEGTLKDGQLVQSNFKGKAYAATDKGMLGICFYFPGDDQGHPPHYQFNVVGPAKIYEKGEHQLKPKNVMQCRDAGPCK